jgi:hypothetical protein
VTSDRKVDTSISGELCFEQQPDEKDPASLALLSWLQMMQVKELVRL